MASETVSTWEELKNKFNDIVTFFKENGITLSALNKIYSFLNEHGLDLSEIQERIANGEGFFEAIIEYLWSSIAEYKSRGDLLESSISFLFEIKERLGSYISWTKELQFVFQMVLAFFNLIFKEKKDDTKTAGPLIDEALKHKIEGYRHETSRLHAHLCDVKATGSIDKDAMEKMIKNFDINTGLKYIGNLRSRIDSLISCDMNKSKAESCLSYMNLFVKVSLIRRSIQLQMLTVLRSIEYSPQTVKTILKDMENDNAFAKGLLSFLETPTVEKSVTFFAFFDFNEQKDIISFAKELNLEIQYLGNDFATKELYITPSADENGENVLAKPYWTSLYGLFKVKRQTNSNNVLFCLELIPDSINRFYIRSSDGKHYVWMTTDRYCKCSTEKPGENGEWIVIRVGDKKTSYLLSPKKWPNRFIYLEKWRHEYARGLDDKQTYSSVRQCLFKLVPKNNNFECCMETGTLKTSTPFSCQFNIPKLKRIVIDKHKNEGFNWSLIDIAHGSSSMKPDSFDQRKDFEVRSRKALFEQFVNAPYTHDKLCELNTVQLETYNFLS